MKKIFLSLLMISVIAVPLLGFAQTNSGSDSIMPDPNDVAGQGLKKEMITDTPIVTILGTVADYVIGIFIIVAVFYVIWAGYLFMTSNGEPDKVGAARSKIMYAGIGVVVALLAKGIISLVLSAITPGSGG